MSKRHRIRARRPRRVVSTWDTRPTATPLADLAGIQALGARYGIPLAVWVRDVNERRWEALYGPWLATQQEDV